MNKQLQQDLKNFQSILENTKQQAEGFLKSLPARPVGINATPPPTSGLSDTGIGAIPALQLFADQYMDQLSGSTGPRYLGFVTGGATPASVAGDWLVSVFDQNLSNFGDSIAPHIELGVIDMLRDLFGLPGEYKGALVTGATVSNFVGLSQARQWVYKQQNIDIAKEGLYGLAPIKVLCGSPHSSIYKALSMAGMGQKHIQLIDVLPEREAVDLQKLEECLKSLNGVPCIVVANAGTVNTVDFDDILAIAKLKDKYNFWLHVDAAFGGFAALSPNYQHLTKGIASADSITIDAHKWLNVPYDCAMQFTRHPEIQLEIFKNSASYLGDIKAQPDFVHLTPENSRRFRALPVWMSLIAYGKSGFREIVERNCSQAQWLSEKIDLSKHFHLLAPIRLNVVCFTLSQTYKDATIQDIQQFLQLLSKDGRVFMTQTVYKGKPGIRAAFSNWRTGKEDLEIIWGALEEVASRR